MTIEIISTYEWREKIPVLFSLSEREGDSTKKIIICKPKT